MIDRDQLREALAVVEQAFRGGSRNLDAESLQAHRQLVEAARLVAEGRDVYWCEEHKSNGSLTTCWHAESRAKGRCRMVCMILIDGNTE